MAHTERRSPEDLLQALANVAHHCVREVGFANYDERIRDAHKIIDRALEGLLAELREQLQETAPNREVDAS